jgi:hypothetical protein
VGHEEAVVGVVVVCPPENPANPPKRPPGDAGSTSVRFKPEESAVFSASLDNTIRCWDDYDVTQRFQFKEKETEISCLGFVHSPNLVITGGDDGTVRAREASAKRRKSASCPTIFCASCPNGAAQRSFVRAARRSLAAQRSFVRAAQRSFVQAAQ